MFNLFSATQQLIAPEEALPGRKQAELVPERHYVKGHAMALPYPAGHEVVLFGMGCFWGAERKFWQQTGVYLTAVGYAGGYTPNPNYEEVCTGQTGHAEVVQVVYDPGVISFEALLKVFWESHDPTQGMRQGNDRGTQYRSCLYVQDESSLAYAQESKRRYQAILDDQGRYSQITTEIDWEEQFYYADAYHQQYLAKNPDGYCGLKGLGVIYSRVTKEGVE